VAAAPAAAGTYTVSACTAAQHFNQQAPRTHAFAGLSALPNIQTSGMYRGGPAATSTESRSAWSPATRSGRGAWGAATKRDS
jgi:hypothetical protein